jgi:2-polyprenyl-3-methyl-5-hydroxy-6-metoxy-1,4-benzoquinol methylase
MAEDLEQQGIYADQQRDDLLPWVPRDVGSALDVGCGKGGFGLTLRQALGESARLVGVEAVAEQAAVARVGHGFDEVRHGYFPQVLEDSDERFDLVSFNDVLEHLYDPWTTLSEVHRRLTPSGRVFATIPSIQYAPVVWQLLRGRWDYTDYGTLDRTHVRFFTRATMIELFHKCGFEVDTCVGINNVVDVDPHAWRGRRRYARHLLGNAQWLQFVVIGRPIPSARKVWARE